MNNIKIKDWNHAHEVKESIESNYNVFVHIIGRGCLVTTNDAELMELNGWDDTLAMLDNPTEVEHLTGLEWFEKTINLFFYKIEMLQPKSLT